MCFWVQGLFHIKRRLAGGAGAGSPRLSDIRETFLKKIVPGAGVRNALLDHLQDGILNRGVGVQHPQKEKERALATSRGEIEPGPAVTLAAGITGSR